MQHVVGSAVGDEKGPLRRADHADRHRVRVVEGVADRHHPVARGDQRRVAELRFGQRVVRLLDELNQCAVGQRIFPDHLRLVGILLVGIEADFDFGRLVNHVVVGQNVPLVVNDDTSAGALLLRASYGARGVRVSTGHRNTDHRRRG